MQEKNIDNNNIRVRFAPAPTGMLHLGNVRTALINYIFARQKKGKFVLRIEDTDPQRNFDPTAEKIIENLTWLHLEYNEGPVKGGPYAPYFESQRTELYKMRLLELIAKNSIYRCFCTQEELEKKRQRQIALKQPPRYDRTCLKLSSTDIESKLNNKIPFIWRVKINQDVNIKFTDMARGVLEFDLKNFSDYPITRQDGSFTFIFANCIDDIEMKMSHVFRGEDHLTNTVDQVVLYHAFEKPVPTFWHMPIICDIEGKKLSKRNFGFSLNELKEAGFLPEAICNYLGIIGSSFENEIQSLDELIINFNFEHLHSSACIKYDVEKLKWINHKWIATYATEKLAQACVPFLKKRFRNIENLDKKILNSLIKLVQTDLVTLEDSITALNFYFEEHVLSKTDIQEKLKDVNLQSIEKVIKPNLQFLDNPDKFITEIKNNCKENNISVSTIYPFLRFALTGSVKGPNLHGLLEILGKEESQKRIENLFSFNY